MHGPILAKQKKLTQKALIQNLSEVVNSCTPAITY